MEDDDCWADKVEVLVEAAPPVVSFTFGLPDLRRCRGSAPGPVALWVQTVTSAGRQARLAAEAGMDGLAVQSAHAGGHWGTFTPERVPARVLLSDLVAAVVAATDLPVLAAGGVGTGEDVRAALDAGAQGRGRRDPAAPRP